MNKEDCLFCKIATRQIPAKVVYEDQKIMAIEDINPAAPVHILIIPKQHISSLNEVTEDDGSLLGHIQIITGRLARELEISDQGYRLINNCGEWGGQDVLHLHYHLLGGRVLGWPPG